MNPWRAALTSATASGNRTRIASRSAIACSSAPPFASTRDRAAAVSSTAVFSVSVANCSRCASATDSACCSANSRSPRIRSSGSPPNGNEKPPSMRLRLAELCLVPGEHVALELRRHRSCALHQLDERRDRIVTQRLLKPARRGPDRVEKGRRGEPRRRADRPLELERSLLRLLDSLRLLGQPQREQLRA